MKLFRHLAVFLLTSAAAHALESVPQADYHQRRVALAAKLNGGAALLFGTHEPNMEYMSFRQDEDFYYLTGMNEPGGAILIIGDGPATVVPRVGNSVPAHAYREILFLPERNLVTEKYTGEKVGADTPGAAKTSGFDEVLAMSALPAVMAKFMAEDRRRGANLYWQQDMETANAAMHFVIETLGGERMPPAHDVRDLTMDLRSRKSPAEIELLRKAANASIKAQLAGMRAIKPGASENMVSGVEIAEFMKRGCERASYPPIVGSGVHSTTLHYSSNAATIAKGDVVLIDEACEYSMYASDITRTMPATGHFSARQKEIYDIVLGAQRAAEAAFVAGKTKLGNTNRRGDDVNDTLDKVAFDYINTHGKDLHGDPLGKYFLHGVGHSVGIDVHDPMDYSKPLERGNVFTIEPGIYIPEEKIGVRIEDVYYVDDNGKLIDLIADLPHTTSEVESAMR